MKKLKWEYNKEDEFYLCVSVNMIIYKNFGEYYLRYDTGKSDSDLSFRRLKDAKSCAELINNG